MEKDGLIKLPASRRKYFDNFKGSKNSQKKLFSLKELELPPREITLKAGHLNIKTEIVTSKTNKLWKELIDRHHYLGYKNIPGASLKYILRHDDQIICCLGFGSAAWSCAPRDNHIGWNADTRKKNLFLVVNNARFLILPWVKSKNLASRILGLISRRLQDDWYNRYNYKPVLLETFVEKSRFKGTFYAASN